MSMRTGTDLYALMRKYSKRFDQLDAATTVEEYKKLKYLLRNEEIEMMQIFTNKKLAFFNYIEPEPMEVEEQDDDNAGNDMEVDQL